MGEPALQYQQAERGQQQRRAAGIGELSGGQAGQVEIPGADHRRQRRQRQQREQQCLRAIAADGLREREPGALACAAQAPPTRHVGGQPRRGRQRWCAGSGAAARHRACRQQAQRHHPECGADGRCQWCQQRVGSRWPEPRGRQRDGGGRAQRQRLDQQPARLHGGQPETRQRREIEAVAAQVDRHRLLGQRLAYGSPFRGPNAGGVLRCLVAAS